MKISRTLLPVALLVAGVVAAQAQTTYSSISATYTLNPGSVSTNWLVSQNNPPMTIDFLQNAPAFKVGDSTGFSTGSSTIQYNVSSTIAISGLDLILQGDVQRFGRIQWTSTAFSGAGGLGSMAAAILGSSYSGGADGAFTNIYHLEFAQAVTNFTVLQTFALDINGQSLPSTSVATLGLVENNFYPAVPEPASCAVLGIGALALLRRRRK